MPTTQIYLGASLTQEPIWLQFHEGYYPSVIVLGTPGSWKSLSIGRATMETLLADGYTCIYVTITADWMGIQYPNLNPMDVETLRYFHSHWFLQEAGWRTHGINKNRITLMVSPFWRGNIAELEEQYGLQATRWRIPIHNVMIEAMADFYGSSEMTSAGYFKDIREQWEDLRSKRTPMNHFLNTLTDLVDKMPEGQKTWGQKFVNKIEEWTQLEPDPILTEENMLDEMLAKSGRLLIFHLPQEEITNIEAATVSTFLYTIMDICYKHHRQTGNKYCVIVDDVGTFKHSERFRQAMEVFIQRKGRKCGMVRMLIGQVEEDLDNTTVKDTLQAPTFDYRIDTSINSVEINGLRVPRGGACFLHLRRKVFTRKGKRSYKPLLYVSRPPLTCYMNKTKKDLLVEKEETEDIEKTEEIEGIGIKETEETENITEEITETTESGAIEESNEPKTGLPQNPAESVVTIASGILQEPMCETEIPSEPTKEQTPAAVLDNCLKEESSATQFVPVIESIEHPEEQQEKQQPLIETTLETENPENPPEKKLSTKRKHKSKYDHLVPTEDGKIDGVSFFNNAVIGSYGDESS